MPQNSICHISGENFLVSDLEISLRKKFGFDDLPTVKPLYRFRHLGAFWQHWNLHNRTSDFSGKNIISVFSDTCPYPIWHKDEWMKHSNPPSSEIDFSRNFFEQAWEVFQKSPLPHNTGVGNENCKYTDNWWYSKNCYLCHSGLKDEDLHYSYRSLRSKDGQFVVFSDDSELCTDVINSQHCFSSKYLLNCQKISDSAFLYDCRNCSNCMFSFNLRNKKYVFGNVQCTQKEYEKKVSAWNFSSRKVYDKAKKMFAQMMQKNAWHRALSLDKTENVTGNYSDTSNNSENCYFTNGTDESANVIRNHKGKSLLDMHGQTSELVYSGMLIQDNCYCIRFGVQLVQCRNLDYSMYCFQCEDCFGCCGLVGKKFHIFNKQYSESEYFALKEKLITHMKATGEWGYFFPGYFAPNPYEESWAHFYWPLSKADQKKKWVSSFRNF